LKTIITLSLTLLLILSQSASAQDETDSKEGNQNGDSEYEFEIVEPEYGYEEDDQTVVSYDPYESFNRTMYEFNDAADRYILLPIVTGYKAVTPDPVEQGVLNFFSNLDEIRSTFNSILQFKFDDAGIYAGRFVTNSTIGILGLFDPASELGLTKLEGEDFGQTLGWYGVPPGPYLTLPFFGPSNMRDAPARFLDSYYDYKSNIDNDRLRYSLMALDLISIRAQLVEAEAFITGDRYTFLREAYLQRREYLVNDGDMGSDGEFDDFGGEESDDWDEY